MNETPVVYIVTHKKEIIRGFTKKYHCKLLVFYALHDTLESAGTHFSDADIMVEMLVTPIFCIFFKLGKHL